MKKFFLVAVGMVFILTSCEKEVIIEGPPGPQGPQGEAGNANVNTQTSVVTHWNYVDPVYYADIEVSFITAEIIESGAVLVYVRKSDDSYTQLPLTFFQSSTYSTTIEVVSSFEQVRLYWVDSDLTKPFNDPGTQTFKIVVIESSELLAQRGVNPNDYESVSRAFNLE